MSQQWSKYGVKGVVKHTLRLNTRDYLTQATTERQPPPDTPNTELNRDTILKDDQIWSSFGQR